MSHASSFALPTEGVTTSGRDDPMTDLRQGERTASAPAGHGTVLFVGLGAMGTPMSEHLSAGGYDLVLCDLREPHAKALADARGARSVPLEEVGFAAGTATTVILMLPDSRAVEDVLEGEAGIYANLSPGSVVIDMSSSSPSATVRLADRAGQLGVDFVDAPVSGGVAKANTGELSIMVGAADHAFARVDPLLHVLGSDVTHVGPVGAGHAMKALNNLLSAIGLVAASEVLAIGTKFGLEPQVMLDVLNGSTGGNHATRVKMARFVLSGAFDSGFSLQLMVKDLTIALQLAHETSTPAPISASCLEEWAAAKRTLEPGADHTHIAAYVERRAGTELRPSNAGDT